MRLRKVVLLISAEIDLYAIEDWLTEVASSAVAERFVDRIVAHLNKLEYASERGTIRNEAGLRVIGLIDGVSVAFVTTEDEVLVHRVLYRGQSWQPEKRDSADE